MQRAVSHYTYHTGLSNHPGKEIDIGAHILSPGTLNPGAVSKSTFFESGKTSPNSLILGLRFLIMKEKSRLEHRTGLFNTGVAGEPHKVLPVVGDGRSFISSRQNYSLVKM
jgi:hypothetical protein